MKDLLIYLFNNLYLPFLNQSESWIHCGRNTTIKVPSEKLYQFCFFQTLCALCPSESNFRPILEMNRKKVKVDLAILTPEGKYQIELAANVQDNGPHSAESHYNRQVEYYHTEDTVQSAVVIISNYMRNHFFPIDLKENIDYVQVHQPFEESGLVGSLFSFVHNKDDYLA